ncbi:SURF1 family protein [Nocardioides bruguierae]|uniref:SURF1-like protein n=1 Tax=Nocardioides bruguierae TaxID=2945102 RepID=A0A9X2D819_9ACTN|nr:SURF1 family protein [Nocardioides bruguierae]MCM0620997.1 SURF1 family protein [Nocardioides bruguierae]
MAPALAPRFWGLHALGTVVVLATLALSWWQWGAFQNERTVAARDLTQAPVVPLDDVMGPDDAFPAPDVGRPVTLTGTWVPEGTVYVEGREHDGEQGYWVVTPLAVSDDGDADAPAMEVVRGWSPTVEGAPAAPEGTATVVGWLQPTDGTGATDPDRTDDVVPQVRIADLIQHVDQDLYSGYVVADLDATGTENDGTTDLAAADLTQLPDVSGDIGLRNLLYAVQWPAFGVFAIIVWVRLARDMLAAERRGRDEDDDSPDDRPDDGQDDGGPEAPREGRPGVTPVPSGP